MSAFVFALFCSSVARAQQFGQWTWEAVFGAGQRSFGNSIDAVEVSSLDQRDLKFSLGVNGFIIHPAVASFRIGLDSFFSKFAEENTPDNSRWGLRGDLRLFPTGKYRIRAFAGRDLYGYSNPSNQDLFYLRGIPDTSTTWGGRLRVRGGILNGMLVGVERTSLDFVGETAGKDIMERQFVDWSGGRDSFTRRFRLERRYRDYGALDFENDNITANFDQRGDLTDSWTWNLNGIAIRQGLGYGTGGSSSYNTFRVRNQLIHTTKSDNLVDLSYSGGWFLAGGSHSFQSHATTARYRWRLNDGWQVIPFATYGLRLSAETDLRSPQVGISTVWSAASPIADLVLTGNASLAWLQRTGLLARTDRLVGLGASGSAGRGDESNLRTEVEATLNRNQIRMGGEAIIDLPGLVVPVMSGVSEDFMRARVTLRRRWRTLLFSGFSEWTRRVPTGELSDAGFRVTGSTQSAQVGGSRFNLALNFGNLTVQQVASQHVRFLSTSLMFRPWRTLSLRGSYRIDTRQLVLAPDVDGMFAEFGTDLRLGAFLVQARLFVTNESRFSVGERTHRGFTWTVSRRFGGWLPIVTQGPSRGDIR